MNFGLVLMPLLIIAALTRIPETSSAVLRVLRKLQAEANLQNDIDDESREFCDWPDCGCYYIHDECPTEHPRECNDTHRCTLETDKPCCDYTACDSSPCLNGGTCVNVGDTFSCTCPEDFEGDICQDAVCRGSEIDIVYVLDGSGSVGGTDFNTMKDFMTQLSTRFEIGTDKVRVAVEQYGKSVRDEILLNEVSKNGDLAKLETAIANIDYMAGGATYTGEALQQARTHVLTEGNGDRVVIPDILILLTDGAANDRDLQFSEADLLKAEGTTVITIGLGSSSYEEDLKQMASTSYDGTKKLTYVVDFDQLDTIADDIVQEVCEKIKH